MLKFGAATNSHHPLVTQLSLSLMHLSLFDNHHTQFTPTMLYRGEVRKTLDTVFLQKNTIYKPDAFFTNTEILDNIIPFIKEKTALASDEISVFYEIQYTEPLAGSNISRLLNDGKGDVLFRPKTAFIITDIKSVNDEKIVTIQMTTANIEQHEWDKHLYSLF